MMKSLRYLISLFSLLTLFSFSAFSACPEYYRLFGITNLKKKTWETTNVDTKVKKICNSLPIPFQANLEISFSKKDSKFSTRIFRSLTGFWDHPEKSGKWSGGTFQLDILEVNTLVPTWYKGSTMKIIEIESKKTLVETKL